MKVPLVRLLQKGIAWEWGKEQQEGFEKLKKALTEAPVLARPDFSKPFTIQCDASSNAIGAVLSQELKNGEHPIMYASRMLSSTERNFSTTEKEYLAVLWAIRKFRSYHEGSTFLVITDHSALRWPRNLKDATGRLARWALEMQQWQFEIVHRKGAIYHVLDEQEFKVAAFDQIRDEQYLRLREEIERAPLKYRDGELMVRTFIA